MQQLSGVDAGFLAMETGATSGHVCMVAVLDPSTAPEPLTAEVAQAVVAQRLHLLPPLRRRLVEVPFGIARPYWVDDPDFDLDFHVRELGIPAPGDDRQLAEQVARIAARPLDRSRPLWELYLITGLVDGRLALMVKFHHAAMDGVAGAELMTVLLDHTPKAAPTDPPAPGRVPPVPGELSMWLRGVAGLTLQPLQVLDVQRRLLAALPRTAGQLARTGSAQLVATWSRWAGAPARDGGVLGWSPLVAPRTPFNRPITPHRRWAYTSTSLAAVKEVKNAFGVTVNDVVMAACAGALRSWLQARGELPEQPLLAMTPVSVRTPEQRGEYGNRVSGMVAALPTHLPDPVARLRASAEAMRVAKEQHAAIDAQTLQDVAQFAMPALVARGARVAAQLRLADHVTPPYNVVISNVPGPRTPLYFAGALLLGYYPVSIVTDGLGLNITVQSYRDALDIGLVSCRELVPDLWDLLGMLTDSVDELVQAARDAGGPPGPQSTG